MPSARPARTRRRALDPRLGIGVLLVIGSVAGVVGIVAEADDSVEVLAAPRTLVPGDRVTAAELSVRPVRIDDARGLYLAAEEIPSEGVVVTRAIGEGELVPLSAVGDGDALENGSVVVPGGAALARSVDAGASVDLWAARETSGAFAPPVVLVGGATVVRIVETEGLMSSGGVSVELLVPRDRVPRVLEALANDDEISVVPADPGRTL